MRLSPSSYERVVQLFACHYREGLWKPFVHDQSFDKIVTALHWWNNLLFVGVMDQVQLPIDQKTLPLWLKGARAAYPKARICAVLGPHSFFRPKVISLPGYAHLSTPLSVVLPFPTVSFPCLLFSSAAFVNKQLGGEEGVLCATFTFWNIRWNDIL